MTTTAAPLQGMTVLALESRRAGETAELIRRHGGTPLSAPSMREIPLDEHAAAHELRRGLEAGTIGTLILLTGVGTRALVAALADVCPREHFAELLRRTRVVARGPKPVAALRELGLVADIAVPEPNTWREILAALDAGAPLARQVVAVQEYGRSNPELISGLQSRGARVLPVPVYRWALPEDVGPLHEGTRQLAAGGVDLVLFTSARQVDHLMAAAEQLGLSEQVLAATQRIVVASIGPVCSEALQAHGWPVDLEPEHSKLGQLVALAARRGPELLQAKRAT